MSEKTVWTVKGGRNGEREDRLLKHGLIGGGWELLASLKDVQDKEQLAELYASAYPLAGKQARANYVGQLWSLLHRMSEGDLVVMRLKTTGTVAVARISGGYQFREDLGEGLRHCRPVSWLTTDVPPDAFDQDLLYSFGAFLTFGRVKRENAERRVIAATEGRRIVPSAASATDAVEEPEALPDIAELASEQVRQFVSQRFAGHDLAELVGQVLGAGDFTPCSSRGAASRGRSGTRHATASSTYASGMLKSC